MSDECLLQQAFDVELPDNFDPLEIPYDGESYLQKVKYEASQCPDIVVADVSKVDVSSVDRPPEDMSEAQRIPSMMMLNLEDQLEEVAEFSRVRQKIARHRARNPDVKPHQDLPQDLESWDRFCFGTTSKESDKDGLHEKVLPSFSILASLTQCQVLELLDHLVHRLELRPVLTRQHAVWLYSLLVFIELPLLPDTCSTLRTLARTCSAIRQTLLESIHDPQLPSLNLFICLVARYFHQSDLGDDPHDAHSQEM